MSLQAGLHDLRGLRDALPAVYHPDDYEASQRLGRRLRERGSWGVVYESVRRAGGQCAAVFRPRACSECRQAEHLLYLWNRREIAEMYEKAVVLAVTTHRGRVRSLTEWSDGRGTFAPTVGRAVQAAPGTRAGSASLTTTP